MTGFANVIHGVVGWIQKQISNPKLQPILNDGESLLLSEIGALIGKVETSTGNPIAGTAISLATKLLSTATPVSTDAPGTTGPAPNEG